METVNNIASAASKAIWGDPENATGAPQTDEPQSGETGDVKAGEPFDKGNADPSSTTSNEATNPTSSSTTDTNPTTAATDIPSTKTDLPDNTTTTLPVRSEHETSKTGVTLANNPTSLTSTDNPTSSNDASLAGSTPSAGTIGATPATDPLTDLKKDDGLQKESLPETKGISHETPSSTDTSNKIESKEDEDTDDTPSGGKLKGLKEKIKAKLHKN